VGRNEEGIEFLCAKAILSHPGQPRPASGGSHSMTLGQQGFGFVTDEWLAEVLDIKWPSITAILGAMPESECD